MRWLVLLFIIPFALAVSIGDESVRGEHPSMYGDSVAFEDGGRVKVFDFTHDGEFDVGSGSNPSLFGFGLVYGDAGLIKYVNVRDQNVITVGQGVFPSIYADEVVFSARESQLGDDFSNDSDRNDDIIQEYDVRSSELKNLKVVGKFPVSNQRYIVFVTEESQVNLDLNSDGDKNDGVIRIFDRESRGVSNGKVEGRDLAISREGTIAFVSQGKLAFMDARTQKSTVTELKGEHPSIHGDIILFSKDNNIFGYSITSGELARVGKGESPSLFGETAAIVVTDNRGKIIRIITDEDGDNDDVSDFVDNCPETSGTGSDADKDGVGDSCGKKADAPRPQEKPAVQAATVNKSAEPQSTNEESQTTNEELEWYWYVLIIAGVVIIGPYAWKLAIHYYKKRKKSFGF